MADEREVDYNRINEVLMPFAAAAYARAESGIRFVHYTSAQSAFDILKSQCMWMRNATCMNDYNEMRHGLNCIVEAFRTEAGRAFNTALDGCYPDLARVRTH